MFFCVSDCQFVVVSFVCVDEWKCLRKIPHQENIDICLIEPSCKVPITQAATIYFFLGCPVGQAWP